MINTKNNYLFIGGILLSSLLYSFYSNAASIVTKNEDSANVDVIIEPGDGSVLPTSHETKFTIKPGEEKKIELRKEDVANNSTFSVTGKVKMPSLYNKCGPLFIDQDYKVIFVGSKTGGVICVNESLKK